jgi:hypothetical protein
MPFAGGTVLYRDTCDKVAANGYEGFILGSPAGVDPRVLAAKGT